MTKHNSKVCGGTVGVSSSNNKTVANNGLEGGATFFVAVRNIEQQNVERQNVEFRNVE
jgi:hypothetical protein